ncbi:pimeloyl-ACP methyl ester carboxylesterase [Nocardioides salarius]|uniref:Pimeloyl-ACP methyl ester carboxylesterase n=1 Tax=Nocardioides salarius TaxID=374513 RepID=A0ABS2M937_9ACTN|nr:hypothetical protein [Nocardioides salarius]MBM7507705.1 pimeloyl-ACP methyl ester carboxylesterase [Nocardioides salarius]
MHPPTDDPSTAPRRGVPVDPVAPVDPDPRAEAGPLLRVHEAGDDQGAPVVLLHRRGAGAQVWAPLLALGSWSVRLLAPDLADLPGVSEGADAAYVVDSLRATERRALLVVAEGDAAPLAVEMALARPEAVAGLVLLAPDEHTARAVVERLRLLTVPVWAAAGERSERSDQGAASSSVEVPGARWLSLPGVGDEPVTEHPDLLIDLVHGAVAELAAIPRPQDGRRYITWVSSEACVKPSLSR